MKQNKWLDPVIDAYTRFFDKTNEPVIWEVGSRDGHDCYELARRIYSGKDEWFWSNADLVALEPNPAQAKITRKNYPEMRVFEFAASNQNGFAPFKVYHGDEGDVGSSSLDLNWKGDELEGHEIQVEIVRLDSMIENEQIDIMKIDVEGYSREVLNGLGDKLKQVKVLHIETEKWTGSNKAIKTLLQTWGWLLVDEAEQHEDMPDQVWVSPARSD